MHNGTAKDLNGGSYTYRLKRPLPMLARTRRPKEGTPLAHGHSGKCPSGAVGKELPAASLADLRALREHPALQLPVGKTSSVGEQAAVGGVL